MQASRSLDLATALDGVRVADVMTQGLVQCGPDTPAAEVAAMMAEHRVHAIVVAGGDAGWGVISDADLIRGAAEGAGELTAERLAASEPVTVKERAPLEDAAHLMMEHDTTHVLVVRAGQPVGMVSSLDVAAALARSA
jgi:acetoin utilization protein AcuB